MAKIICSKSFIALCITTLFCLLSDDLSGQIYLQLEQAHSLEVRKYQVGDYVYFKTKQIKKEWQGGKIYKILPDDNAILFDDRIVHLDDITKFKFHRNGAKFLGTMMMQFGAAWFVFAGIIEGGRALGVLNTRYKFGADTAVIGGTAILTGFLVKKLLGTTVRKMNKRNRLRIVDLRF